MDKVQSNRDKKSQFNVLFNSESDYDKLLIKSMDGLITECDLKIDGKIDSKKVVYLTNSQASLFNETDMESLVEKLGLKQKKPKFVIKLNPSFGIHSQMKLARGDLTDNPLYDFMPDEEDKWPLSSSEFSVDDEHVIETQIKLFMRTVILPLAKETRAVIFINGTNDCFISATFSKIACAEQLRMGDDCPFTVIATANQYDILYHATGGMSSVSTVVEPSPNTTITTTTTVKTNGKKDQAIAKQIFDHHNCIWKKRVDGQYISDNYLSEQHTIRNSETVHAKEKHRLFLPRCDLNNAPSCYIIFENTNISNGEYEDEPSKAFDGMLLRTLTKTLPSVAIQSLYVTSNIQYLVDLVKSNIPVLLIDTTERAITCNKMASKMHHTRSADYSSNPNKSLVNSKSKNRIFNRSSLGSMSSSGGDTNKVYPYVEPHQDTQSQTDARQRVITFAANNDNDSFINTVIHRANSTKCYIDSSTYGSEYDEKYNDLESNSIFGTDKNNDVVSAIYQHKVFQTHFAYANEETYAFPNDITDEWMKEITIVDNMVSLEGRKKILSKGKEMLFKKWIYHAKLGVPDLLDGSLLSFLKSLLKLGSSELRDASLDNFKNKNGDHMNFVRLCDKIAEIEEKEKNNVKIKNDQLSVELVRDLLDFVFTYKEMFNKRAYQVKLREWYKRMKSTKFEDLISQKKTKEAWNNIEYVQGRNVNEKYRSTDGNWKIDFSEGIYALDFTYFKVDELIDMLGHYIKYLDDNEADINASYLPNSNGILTTSSYDDEKQEWLQYFDLLSNSKTFSGSIFEIDDLRTVLGEISGLGRLPGHNSLEALKAIQDAWDHVELYARVADWYKFKTKLSFYSILIASTAVTMFTILGYNGVLSLTMTQNIIVGLGFFSTAVFAYVAFSNPVVRWQLLRRVSMQLISMIWSFRTRTGEYCNHTADGDILDQDADEILKQNLAEIKNTVLVAGDLKNTNFFSKSSSMNKHFQHRDQNDAFGVRAHLHKSLFDLFTKKKHNSSISDPNYNKKKIVKRKNLEKHFHESVDRMDDHLMDDMENGIGINRGVVGKNTLNSSLLSASPSLVSVSASLHEGTTYELNEVVKVLRNKAVTKGPKIDNHFDVITPDEYLELRVRTAIVFYKGKIPSTNSTRNITQILLVCGSLMTSILSFLNLTPWAALVVIITSSITAYLEFNGTNGKIIRYSSTAHELEELVIWWNTLPKIERNDISNINKLVATCEGLLMDEFQSWMTTSQASKMMNKMSSSGSGGNQNDRQQQSSANSSNNNNNSGSGDGNKTIKGSKSK